MLKLPEIVNNFLNQFKENGYQIYLVGGAVRNLLLNHKVTNWDFATSATPEKILKIFPDGYYNNKYGTVTIQKDKLLFEVTTFRKESDYKDLRHPEKIEWAHTIEEDLSRRDFTINAIALRLTSFAQGKPSYEVIDPFNGQQDIKDKLIRAVGEPDKRFNEDALRLIRAVRFACQFEFLIEDKTRESLQKNAALITKISWERIRDELFKIIGSENASEGILFLRNTGLLTFILPELDICFIIPQKSPKRHHIYDVGTHSVMALKYCQSKDVITRFATLLHDIGKSKTFQRDDKTGLITFYNHEVVSTHLAENIAKRLKLSNKEKDKLVKLIRYHQFTVSEIQTDKAVRRFIREVTPEYLDDIIELRKADRIGSGARATSWRFELFKKRLVEVQKEPFKITDLKIDGKDVMKILDIKPGPKIGQVLQSIFNDVENGGVKNEREELLSLLHALNKQ